MPFPITTRLLCAAQQTYEIVAAGPAPDSPGTPGPAPSTLVGWLNQPKAMVGGDDQIAAVLVGETDGEIIVAYRGTEPFDSIDHQRMVLDWLTDLIDPLVTAPDQPGSVHKGFSHTCNVLWSWVLAEVQSLPFKTKPLYVTGHSKGGAVANLAAVKFVAAGLTPFVCTFEGARVGDQAFADGYAKAVQHSTRYEYKDDIVPHLPPDTGFVSAFRNVPLIASLFSALVPTYVPVGDLRFVNWQDQIVADSPALESLRYSHLINLFTGGGCDTIIADHSIGPGSGAAAAICGPIWKPAPAPALVVATVPPPSRPTCRSKALSPRLWTFAAPGPIERRLFVVVSETQWTSPACNCSCSASPAFAWSRWAI